MDELFEPELKKGSTPKQIGHLYRKLFLLVMAIALLGQCILLVDKGLQNYYQKLADSFKIILTVDGPVEADQLERWGQSLNEKEDVVSVRLFSPDDALVVVRHKNPQLVDSLLLMGKNQMPAYFEIRVTPRMLGNIRPFVDNLATQYEELTPHYNQQHARLAYYTGLYSKLLRVLMVLSLLGFLAFMFLVEASACSQGHALGGVIAGLLASLLCVGIVLGVLYPTGMLEGDWQQFTSWHRQVLLLVFCGLLGWTLSKWQKF